MTSTEKTLENHEVRIKDVETKVSKIEPTVEFSKYFGRIAIVSLLGLVGTVLGAVILKFLLNFLKL